VSHNVSGQAYALTVLAPILDGRARPLAEHLDRLDEGPDSPLGRVPGTHLARWVVLEDVKYQGAGQRRRDHFAAPRLLFASNFDGSLGPYLEALRTGLGADADAVWGHCRGYPGHRDATGFAGWMRAHQVGSSLFFAAYGTQTVADVHANLRARSALIEFALAARGLEPAALKARFLERFPP
jgi:hypothetical protein